MKDVQVGCVRFATIVMLGLLANATPGHLRPAAAESVRDACTHDAFRLCSNAIPNVGRTKACLARHQSSLSPGCRAAFAGRSKHERSAEERSAQKRSAEERRAEKRAPERSAQEPAPERSAQEAAPERSTHERRYRTHARHYGYARHYHRYRRFHFFPFF